MVIVDTNIIIDHLRRTDRNTSLDKIFDTYTQGEVCLSMVTVQELFEGKSTKKKDIKAGLLAIVNSVRILPYTYDVAILAGKIARDHKLPIGLADAAIAATSVVNGLELVTLNKKHFDGIPDLKLYDMAQFN